MTTDLYPELFRKVLHTASGTIVNVYRLDGNKQFNGWRNVGVSENGRPLIVGPAFGRLDAATVHHLRLFRDDHLSRPGEALRKHLFYHGTDQFAVYTDAKSRIVVYGLKAERFVRFVAADDPEIGTLIPAIAAEVLRITREAEQTGPTIIPHVVNVEYHGCISAQGASRRAPFDTYNPRFRPSALRYFSYCPSLVTDAIKEAEKTWPCVVNKEANDRKRDEEVEALREEINPYEVQAADKPDPSYDDRSKWIADARSYFDEVFPLLSTANPRHRAWMIGVLKFLGKNDE